MDLLKAELERKRRAIAESSSKGGGGRDGGDGGRNGGGSKRKKYLTAAERRRLEEEEDEREEELRRREKKRRRKKKKRKDDSDDDEDDDGKESEDLTTILTKKYDPAERRRNVAAAAAAAADKNQEENNANGDDNDATRDEKEQQSQTGSGGEIVLSDSLKKLSPEEVTNTLRRFGLPIRLFGEQTIKIDDSGGNSSEKYDDTTRLRRLAIAMKGHEAAMLGESERDEFLLDSANRTRNVFLEKDAHNDDNEGDGAKKSSSAKSSKSDNAAGDGGTITNNTAAMTEEELNDKPKRIYRYFKTLLRQWEDDLSKRPDSVKRTAAGKNETKTLKQCKDYIRPLFQLCKRRELEEDLQLHLFNIVIYCESGEFVKAHDAYMDVAIGRAAWPIGVTMVGIHARSGRAKIESSNVAHVMNSELHRKYLTSVKRLMSYAQKKRPDVHPSKKVMNL